MAAYRVLITLLILIACSHTHAASAQVSDAAAAACLDDRARPLRIVLRAIAPTAARVLDDVRAEVAAIWPRQGVPVEWVAANSAAGDEGVLYIVVQDGPPPSRSRAAVPPLAFIRFEDGQPGRTIYASTGSAARLLARWLRRHGLLQVTPTDLMAPGLLDTLTARLTGWAVAHEIGHYVLATARHDAVGLMRRGFIPHQVIAADVSAVTLASRSAERLSARAGTCLDRRTRR